MTKAMEDWKTKKYGRVIDVFDENELKKRTHPAWSYLYLNPGQPVEPEKVNEILRGGIDVHIHGAPLGGWLPGRPTMVQTCIEASEAGMKALVFKDHNTMVNNCAIIIQDFLGRMQKEREAMGLSGGIRVSDCKGTLTQEMMDVLDIMAEYNDNARGERVVLSACHVSNEENELVMNGGVNPVTGDKLINSEIDFETAAYEEIEREYSRMMHHIIAREEEYWNAIMLVHNNLDLVHPIMSVLLDDCLEKGKHAYEGGCRYNDPAYVISCGLINVANSLSAIDMEGPTGLIRSATKIHTQKLQSTLFNMKFNPTAIEGKAGSEKFIKLNDAYFKLGGYQIQYNIVDRNMLLDAQEHPENYTDLMVRVAGFTARFIDLGPDVQRQVIERTEFEAL